MKRLLAILLSLVSIICVACTFTACGNEQQQTELSDDDKDILRYHQEPTLEMDFEDNKVGVILKSAYDDLEEISFKDIKIVEKVSQILYVDLYTREISYSKNGKFDLNKNETNHMFDIVLEEHSKEKVLEICELLETLDMVLCAEPEYIYSVVETWMPEDVGFSQQKSLKFLEGINVEKAWDITRGCTDVKVGIMEANLDMTHQDLEKS